MRARINNTRTPDNDAYHMATLNLDICKYENDAMFAPVNSDPITSSDHDIIKVSVLANNLHTPCKKTDSKMSTLRESRNGRHWMINNSKCFILFE